MSGLGVGGVVVMEYHVLHFSVGHWFGPQCSQFFSFLILDLSSLPMLNDINSPIICLRMMKYISCLKNSASSTPEAILKNLG